MHQILRFAGQYVVIGGTCDDPEAPCPGHPRVWLSPDGVTWSRAPWDPAVFAPHVGISATVTTGEGLLGVGYVCLVDGVELNAEDWTAYAFGEVFIDAMSECPFAVWSSSDGSTWKRIYLDDDPLASVSAITTGGPGFVAVGEAWDLGIDDNRPAAWTSTDGRTWIRADTPDDRAGGINRVVTTDNGFVGAGWLRGQDRNRHFQTAMWFSPDGASWTLVHDEGTDSSVSSIAIGGPGLLIAGSDDATNPDRPQAALWISSDGLTWSQVSGADAGLGDGFVSQIVAVGESAYIVVTDYDGGDLVGFWTAPT